MFESKQNEKYAFRLFLIESMASLSKSKTAKALLCFVAFLLFYGLTSRSDFQSTDEIAVFASGISLESHGNLAIDKLQWLNKIPDIRIGQLGHDGHFYTKYFPGNIISTFVIYGLTNKQNDQPYFWSVPKNLNPSIGDLELAASNTGARMALKANAMFGALAMTALFLLLNLYFDWKTSLVTVLLTGICSDWWYESRGFFSEVGAGAFLITSLYFAALEQPYRSSLALGLSLLFRPTNIIALPIWGKAIWNKRRIAIWSSIGIVLGLIILASFNWIRFGSIFQFGYVNEGFTSNVLMGLYGILLSPGRSLFVYSPILTLAIPGAWLLYKKEKGMTVLCLWIVISYLILVASWHDWDGGWSWGSRLLTPVIPILGFLTASTVEYAWGKRGDILVIAVFACLGLGIQIIALARDPIQSLVDSVIYGGINYNETIATINNSWLILQLRSLQHWQICDLDAYTLRQWFTSCP